MKKRDCGEYDEVVLPDDPVAPRRVAMNGTNASWLVRGETINIAAGGRQGGRLPCSSFDPDARVVEVGEGDRPRDRGGGFKLIRAQ